MLLANKSKGNLCLEFLFKEFFSGFFDFLIYLFFLSFFFGIKVSKLFWPIIFSDYYLAFGFVIIVWNYENQDLYYWIISFLSMIVHVKAIRLIKEASLIKSIFGIFFATLAPIFVRKVWQYLY